MNRNRHILIAIAVSWLGTALAADSANGTAVVRVADSEYTIPIICDDAAHPEVGLLTEPGRITRERTGRSSGVRLTIRRWKETDQVIVNLDRYVAWIPRPETGAGILQLSIAMSAASTVKDGMPTALTYEDWVAGDRPEGLDEVSIEADCRKLDADAPSFRKLQ